MLVMLSGMTAWGQTLADYKYSTGTNTGLWRAFSSPTTILTGGGDYAVSAVYDLGFSFKFGATNYTQFSVNADGNLKFGETVTGTRNYNKPFSTDNDNVSTNAPKINFFGCDGYMPSEADGGYVKYEVLGTTPNRVCVIEFATSTYSSSSRGNIYSWQVQLYETTNKILVVYPSSLPSVNPAVECQHGMCTGGNDIILVDASHNMTHYTSGQSTTIAASTWPDAGRYYLFDPNVTPMELGVTYSGTLGTIGVWSSYTSCSWSEPGEEHVYSFTPSFSSSYIFTAAQPSGDPDFMLMSSFGNTGTNVVGGNWNLGTKTVTLNAGTTYYLIADNASSSSNASYTVNVQVAPATIPYTCSFDTDSESVPWTLANASQPNYWMVGSATSVSPSNALYITNDSSSNDYNKGSTSYVYAYRTINFTSTGTYIVSFKWKCYGESTYDLLRAFLIPTSVNPTLTGGADNGQSYNTNNVPTGWIDVANPAGKLNLKYDWQVSSQSVDISSTGNYYLVFFWKNDGSAGNSPSATIDNVEIVTPCTATATLSYAVPSSNSVSLTRNSGSGVKYEVLVSTSSDVASVTETPVEMTSETQTITGLTPATQYYAYIRTYCTEYTHGSWSSALSFVTTCDKTATLTANAQGATSVSLTRTSGDGVKYDVLVSTSSNPATATESPVAMTSTTQTVSGLTPSTQYYAYIRSYCTQDMYGPWSSAVSFVTGCDKTSTLIADVQNSTSVSLTRTSGDGVKYDILVSTSSNPATATESPVAMTSETQTVIGLTPATQYYAYIRSYCTASIYGEWSSAVGFVTYDVCSAVSNLTATAGPVAADITWSYTGQVSRYQLFVSLTAMTESELENAELIEVTDPSYTATGLSAVTGYYVYVRPVCNDYESGAWTSVQFTTLNDVYQLPYHENFEDVALLAWTTTNGTNGWYVGSATSNGGNNSFYISSNNGESNEYNTSATSYSYAYCKLNINEQCVVNVSFDWNANGEGSYDLLRAFMIPVSENPTLSGDNGMSSMSNDAPARWIDVSENGGKLNLSTAWEHSSKDMVFLETGDYYLVFFWKNDGSVGSQPPAAVDNISVEVVSTCMPVQNVIAAPGRDRVVISWDEIYSSSQWQVLVSASSSASSATETPVSANSTSITISNLERNTTYYAFVRALCSESESSPWSDAVSFTTLDACSPVDDLSIDEYTSNSADLSWTCLDADAGLWQVIVTTADDAVSATEEPLLVYNTSATVSGLAPNTQYNVFVRTHCGEYGYSAWESVSFKTSPVSVTLPYFVDFEGTFSDNWVFENGTNGWYAGRSTNNGGARSLYISYDMGVSNYYSGGSDNTSYAYFTFNVEQTSIVNMSFDWKCEGESTYDYMRAFIVPASIFPSFTAGATNGIGTSGRPSYWIAVDDGKMNGSSSWNTMSKNVTLNQGLYYAVFYWCNDNSVQYQPPAAIDNVSVSIVTACLFDGYVSVSDISKTSATVSWHDNDEISQWEFLLTTASSPEEATETPMLLDVTSITVSDLAMGTDYNVYVRPYCSESNRGIWTHESFTTLPSCLPVEEVRIEEYGQTWVIVSWTNVEDLASQWEVLVTRSNDPSNATETPILVNTNTVTVNELERNTDYNVFVRAKCSESEYSEWKTTWTFTTYPPCVPPYDFSVLVTPTRAKVSWYDVYDRLETRIVLSETEKTDLELADAEYENCYSNYKTFNSLTPGLTYHLYASTACGNGEYGDWVHFQFATPELEAMPLPYTQDFEDGIMTNWAISNNSTGWYWGKATAKDSESSLYLSYNEGVSYSYTGGSWNRSYSYAYCRLNIDHQSVVRVKFDWKCYGRYYYDCMRAFLVPVSINPSLNAGSPNGTYSYPDGWINVADPIYLCDYYYPGAGSDWQTNIYDLNMVQTGDYYLVFFWMDNIADRHDPPAAIDNISVTYLTDCIFSGDINIDNINKTSADVSWTTVGPATQWQILATEANSPENATETPVLVSSSPYTLTGLNMNTTYHTYIRSYCSETDQGIWVRASDFTTLPPCEPPYGISAMVTTNTAIINWSQPYQYDNFNFYFSQSEMTDAQLASADYSNISSNFYYQDELVSGQTYHAYISSGCALGETSEWVSFEFQTAENNMITLPYYQDFESDVIEGWEFSNQTNGWYLGSAVAQSGDKSLYISENYGQSYYYNTDDSYSYAYCKFHVDFSTSLNVSFDWQCRGVYTYDYMRAFVVPASSYPSFYGSNGIGNDGYNIPYGWSPAGDPMNSYNSNTSWQHHSQNVEIPSDGDYYFVLFWKNTYMSSYNPPAAVDNLALTLLSRENDITSFTFAGMVDAEIDTESHTVTCSVPYSLNLSSVKPTITVSDLATITPESNTYINLNSAVVYVVTSEDGTEQEWTVTAVRLPVSYEAEILSFWTDGLLSVDINSANATVDAVISRMYDITSVSPTFGISNLATINHTNGTAYDFSSPRQFVVTAENQNVKYWTVNVSYGDSPYGGDCSNPYIVDAENDLPYSHSASTAGLYSMYNTYDFGYPLYMEGNDAVYRIDLPYMMRLNISVSSASEGYSVFVMGSCGAQASYIDYKTDIVGSESLIVDLPAGSVYVVIDTYGEDIDYNIQISNISHCYTVNDIEVTRLQTELDVAWSSENVGDTWTLKYGLEGFDIDTEGTQVEVDEPSYVITNLSESTSYDIYVRANCGVIGNSDWTQVTVSTIASCQMPDALAVVDVYDVDATLSWEGFNMTQWEVQYSKEGESNYTSLIVDEPVVALTGLQISTEYNVKVRSICDGSYSDFAELNFATECTIVRDFPYVENFDGEIFPPVCWQQERTAAGSGSGIGYANGAWMRSTSSAGANTTPKAMLADTKAGSVHNLATLGLLFTESINGYDISLDVYRSTASESSDAEGVEVWVNSYPDIVNGTPRKLGYVSKNYQTESAGVNVEDVAGWYTYTFSAREMVGVNYVILVGKSNNAGGVYVDNLTVEKAVDCIVPSNLVVETVGEDSLVMAWTDANAVHGTWTVRYSLNGGEVVETSVDEQRLTITGLQAGTIYNISAEIQGICALGVESDWYSATLEAKTDCSSLDLTYTQDFEVADGELPDCWRTTSDRSNVWLVSNGLAYLPYGNSQVEAHLLSPRFNFAADSHYMLEFDVLQSTQNITRPDSLYVLFVGNGIDTLRTVAIQNASTNGMSRMSIALPQYDGEARLDFVLSGYRECSIDNFLLRPLSREAEILSFEIEEQTSESIIDSENAIISAFVADFSDGMYFMPTFTISENATVNVPSGQWRDFSGPVEYIVTAEDGVTTKTWTVTVGIDETFCPNPSADDIDFIVYNDSAVMYLYPANNETSYNLKISSQPIDPEIETADLFDGMVEPDSTHKSVIEGLDVYTYYYIYVQSNCGATGWTEKTSCGVFALPYEQDFSAADCWEIFDVNNDNKTWTIANGESFYSFSRISNAEDHLVSPKLRIVQNAKLEFKYKVGNFSYPETFSVYVKDGNDMVKLDSLTVTNETYQTYGPVDLSDFAGQFVEIVIACQSEANMYRLYVDDFKVEVSDYVINVSSVGNGSVSPDGRVEVAPGESAEFVIIPDEYNELLSLMLDDEDVTADIVDGVYTLADVNDEHNLVATFTERYTVTASAGEGGRIVTEGITVADKGDTVSFVVIPDEGYRPGDVIVDGFAEQLEHGSYIYTFENVDAYHTIHATFDRIIYHTVHVEAGANGIVTPNGDVVVEEGESLTISVIPEEGYIIHEFIVDGTDASEELIANGYNYTFENITDDHAVRVSFVENVYYSIAVSFGEHGTITPNGDVSVENGTDQTFYIVPDAGYHIESVTVDGEYVASAVSEGEYTFVNVTEDHTIHAEFAINTYTIVAYAQGGTITPNGTITVNHGDELTLEFEPDEEYELLNLMVDNMVQEVDGNTYTFDSITADHAVVAIFIPMNIIRHEITATAGEHGSISPSGRVRVVEGESQIFQILPDEHYYISSLIVDGETVDVADSYQFQNVTSDHTISASFEAYKHTVTAIAGEHGSVTPAGEQEVDEGSDITFTFAPSVGYIVSEVLVDDVSVEFTGNSYTLQNVLEDHVVRVNFDLLPMWNITAVSGANGTISPSGTQYVLNGDDIGFTFVPNEGYMLDRVVVDGLGFTPESNTYRFENVTENHYIYVSFRPLVYFITAEAGPHGQLSPSGVVEVEPGATQVFTFNPYIGYELDSVFVDGEYIITDGNTYEFVDVNENHTFRVTFKHIAVEVGDEISMTASLYPNPNDGRFMVDFAGISGNVVYQLVNASGAIIEERDIYVDEGMTMEFYHELRPGVYFARLVSGDKVLVERFVVE